MRSHVAVTVTNDCRLYLSCVTQTVARNGGVVDLWSRAQVLFNRACLHGVADPGLVELVSFVFTLWGTQNKRNVPH